ncbi:MAG: FimV/HubP family polar landmark protein [Pseudomonas sp.]|uniref:FimV/HubP family polar landmark protein n=1 Tax=Pseudomonas sp. TaxID=306 RepID=UPI0030F2202A
MARVRKLVLAIAAASALTSGMAHALGLGEVTLKSALNQPLDAEIELVEVRDLSSTEVVPNLASPEEFNKAGIDRQFFLTDLKFTPVLKPNGKSVIRVTSSKPIREPYLNFLVEVLWPSGRVLREYTVLLDPPLYSPQAAAAAAPKAPVAAPAAKPAIKPTVPAAPAARPAAPVAAEPAPAARPAAPAPAPSPAPAGKVAGDTYKTTSSDTLWEVAQRTRSSGSVQQAMLAIQDLNPDAFLDGNINRLKSGQVLRLPDDQQIKARSQSDAIAQVAQQTSAWREGRGLAASGARQLDATKRATAGDAPAKTDEKDSLKLLSGDAGKAAKGSDKGASGDTKALNDKLAVTKESLDSTRRENDELKGRMTDLQSQLDKLNRLIQLKDSQMAKLQADIAAKGNQPAANAAAAAAAPAAAASTTPAIEPAKPAAAAEATPPVAATGDKPAAPDYNYSDEQAAKPADSAAEAAKPAEAEPAPAPAPTPAPAPAPQPEAQKPAPAPVVEPQPAEETSFVDDLFANPMLLGIAGGGALLLLLIGLMVLSRRNAQKEAQLHIDLAADDEPSPFNNDLDVPDTSFDNLDSDLDAPLAPTKEERVTAQTGDVLGEADIYIAYGRFTQAAELLQDAINNEPHRADLRLKLMEVQAELGDQEGFARQERELNEIGGAYSEIEQLKSRYPGMAVAALGAFAGANAASALDNDADNFSLDDLTLDDPEPAAAPADDMDLSLDDLEAELDRDLTSGSNDSLNDFGDLSLGDDELDLTSTSSPAASGLSDLDFDLSLDDTPSTSSNAALSDDLADFSLDLDEPKAAAPAEEDDFLLSLDDDLSSSSSSDFSSTNDFSSNNDFADLSLEPDATPELDAGLDAEHELPADFDLSVPDDAPSAPVSNETFAAKLDEVTAELDQMSEKLDLPEEDDFDSLIAPASSPAAAGLDADDDFDFLSGTDETATKLDLARAYIDMGDSEGARDILDEVISEGSDAQQQEARELIARIV